MPLSLRQSQLLHTQSPSVCVCIMKTHGASNAALPRLIPFLCLHVPESCESIVTLCW